VARIAIVGGGISGLCAAVCLSDHEVTLLEAGPQTGGKLRSENVDGAILEAAANGLLDAEPAVRRLIEKLGLQSQVITAAKGPRYVFLDGEMRAVPSGPPALLCSAFLSMGARARILTEPFRTCGPADESIAEFTRRRVGAEVLHKLVAPMVMGIHAGDPESLSVSACFPTLKALETQQGSLARGFWAQRKKQGPGTLISFRGGLSTLIDALTEKLGSRVKLNARCTALTRNQPGWQLSWNGTSQDFDAVVLACPPRSSAALIDPISSDTGDAIRGITTAAVGVVALVLPTENWRLPEGFGCLVPDTENAPGILGVLFTSNIFPTHAPQETAVVRIIIGGTRNPLALDATDDVLLEGALSGCQALLGALPTPSAIRIYRYPDAIPQYTLGHLERVQRVRDLEDREIGLFLTGNHLDGVAVKDCIRSAEQTAARVHLELSR
jgi:oxygen-dependent protoporphyrinogen oxidase